MSPLRSLPTKLNTATWTFTIRSSPGALSRILELLPSFDMKPCFQELLNFLAKNEKELLNLGIVNFFVDLNDRRITFYDKDSEKVRPNLYTL